MGCGGSTGEKEKIEMKKTKLADVDSFFDDTQAVIDSIYELQDPIEESKEEFLESTAFDKVSCATTHHAIVGTVFAVYATAKAADDAANAVDITMSEPYIKFDTGKLDGSVAGDAKCLTTYIDSLIKANGQIQTLVDKVKTVAEKAPDLPGQAKTSLEGSTDLGAMDK